MSTPFFDIQVALETQLNGISGHPTILWENEKFNSIVHGTTYWRPTLIPVQGQVADTNMSQLIKGIYQIDVFVRAEEGTATILTSMDSIFTAFNIVAPLTAGSNTVNIYHINRSSILTEEDTGWCKGSLDVYFECYT